MTSTPRPDCAQLTTTPGSEPTKAHLLAQAYHRYSLTVIRVARDLLTEVAAA